MTKSTTDIWFASFLMIKGEKLTNYSVISRGKVSCIFTLTDEQWQKYKLEFNNSEYIKFKTTVEQIKDLGY